MKIRKQFNKQSREEHFLRGSASAWPERTFTGEEQERFHYERGGETYTSVTLKVLSNIKDKTFCGTWTNQDPNGTQMAKPKWEPNP